MRITVNGHTESLPDGTTIVELLVELKLAGSPCAVEVNRVLVPRREQSERRLAPNDIVEIVTLVGGG